MTLGYPSNHETSKNNHFVHKEIEKRPSKTKWGAVGRKLYFVIKHGDLFV